MFVAGFIGSPGMNFLPARLADEGGRLVLRLSPSSALRLPEARREAFAPLIGRDILAGIRPEHFMLATGAEEGGTVEARADIVEPLGMETLVHLAIGDTPVVARLAPDPGLVPGARLRLAVKTEALCLAEPESGRITT
jgi:multiple sugar transport system ATP-binding protein